MTSPLSAPGPAGVAAARRLSKSGLRAVVLEASARALRQGRTHADACPACRSISAAAGCIRPSATPGPASPKRRGSSSTAGPGLGVQYTDRGFSAAEHAAARRAYAAWFARLETAPPPSDRAGDALEPGCEWNGYIDAISSYMNGETLDRISVADVLAYDEAATDLNWRTPAGYWTLIAASLPAGTDLRLAAPVEAIALAGRSVSLTTRLGEVRASAAIVTISTTALLSGAIRLPPDLEPWLRAAEQLPLGRNEKLYFEIDGPNAFAPESHVNGNPRDARAGSYYIRPFGRPVIECFLGGPGGRDRRARGARRRLSACDGGACGPVRRGRAPDAEAARRLELDADRLDRRGLQPRPTRLPRRPGGSGASLRRQDLLCRRGDPPLRLLDRPRRPRHRGPRRRGGHRGAETAVRAGDRRLSRISVCTLYGRYGNRTEQEP